ncbi:MAG: 6-bladed beta-propeller [Tannerellaceae bacterium]|jgi:hypothetical protein|nr:6-bladed beta-propeller [Tannerellaceae bacterium]
MKKSLTISATILLVMAGCGESRPAGELITVDVTAAGYPKKELILQDFMDVEYIPLETTDEFITQGFVQDVGKDIIVVRNRVSDGDIFIFDRKTGKALKKINRKGQGGEEYTNILIVTLDEDNGEMFVNDLYIRKILVYDMDGNFKRSFEHKEGAMYDHHLYNFDRDNLICHDSFYSGDGVGNMQPFMIISKQDGSITRDIQIPFEERILTVLRKKDEASNMTYSVKPSTDYPIIPCEGGWIIVEPSSDTIYRYSPDHSMTPILVRTPPVRSMDPEVFLFLSLLTDRYYFMETIKKIWDFERQEGLTSKYLMYDRQEKAIYEYTVYNDDYSTKKQVYMNRPSTEEVATWQILEAPQLVGAYGKGELKGRLAEIAAGLDEESNPVIMLLKHKKK